MSQDFPLADIAQMKQALQLFRESSQSLKNNLIEIQEIIRQMNEVQNESEVLKSSPESEIEELEQQLKELKAQLIGKEKEIDRMQRQQKKVINRIKRAAFFGPREIYKALGQGHDYPLDRMQRENERLKKIVADLERKLEQSHKHKDKLEVSIQNLNGVYERTLQEKKTIETQLSQAGPKAREEILCQIIVGIGPLRLGQLLSEDLTEIEPDNEKIKVSDRIIEYLRALDLNVSHKAGIQVQVSEQDIVEIYDLDEVFQKSVTYKVISPGFRIKDKLIIKPRIRKNGERSNADEKVETSTTD